MRIPKIRNIGIAFLIVGIFVTMGLLIAQDQETLQVKVPLAAEDSRFPDYLARLAGHPITTGDSYTVLHNGDETFPAMLRSIDDAKRRISFESYIFSDGEVSRKFTRALIAAARRGVRVQMVLDAVGTSDREKDAVEELRQAGAQIGLFNPVTHSTIEELNFRTHRKILVVDGEVAYIGGIGLADHWQGDADSEDHWRDSQFEIRGPAVDNIEAGFQKNWIETGGLVEPIVAVRTDPPRGDARTVVVWSAAEAGFNAMKLVYLLAIGASRKTLDIQSPYLIADESTLWSLYEARKRGVRIRLLTEGDKTDAKPVKFAGRAYYDDLLKHGIEVHEYQPTMMHVKAMVVDGTISIVGSANFDNRSLELNDELNVVVAGRALAEQLTRDFDADTKRSEKIDLEKWRSRPLHIRAREQAWSFFGEIF
jgi:cardiolipin synthase A/B